MGTVNMARAVPEARCRYSLAGSAVLICGWFLATRYML